MSFQLNKTLTNISQNKKDGLWYISPNSWAQLSKWKSPTLNNCIHLRNMRLRKTVGIVNSNADAREIKRSRFQPNTKQTSVPREDISIVIGLFIQFQDIMVSNWVL